MAESCRPLQLRGRAQAWRQRPSPWPQSWVALGSAIPLPGNCTCGLTRPPFALAGPFSSEDMTAWLAEGYFRGDSAVWVRRVGDGTGSYQKSDEVAKFD